MSREGLHRVNATAARSGDVLPAEAECPVTFRLCVVCVTQDLFRPGVREQCFQRQGNLT